MKPRDKNEEQLITAKTLDAKEIFEIGHIVDKEFRDKIDTILHSPIAAESVGHTTQYGTSCAQPTANINAHSYSLPFDLRLGENHPQYKEILNEGFVQGFAAMKDVVKMVYEEAAKLDLKNTKDVFFKMLDSVTSPKKKEPPKEKTQDEENIVDWFGKQLKTGLGFNITCDPNMPEDAIRVISSEFNGIDNIYQPTFPKLEREISQVIDVDGRQMMFERVGTTIQVKEK